jgi:hypothetical protein
MTRTECLGAADVLPVPAPTAEEDAGPARWRRAELRQVASQ